MDQEEFTKRERKKLLRAERRQEEERAEQRKKLWSLGIKLLAIGFVAGVGWLFWREATKPLPGEAVADQGREHVPEGTQVEYNSNPPTSGPHYADWTRAGVYDDPIEDGYLVHSLEHGYVILSYNCEAESPLSEEECGQLASRLSDVWRRKGERKLIVVPRPQNDSRIAVTAWRRIMKLDSFDERAIEDFIDTFRDRGPEQTME